MERIDPALTTEKPMDTSALPIDVSQYIENEIAAGAFASPDELLATAVREHRERKEKLRTLRAEIDKGYAAIERGEYIEITSAEEHEDFFQGLLRESKVENGALENGK
jgi:Arc/MetJ-type ribon-helix-helix transcriptional regulator